MNLQGLLGIVVLVFLAWAVSEKRQSVRWKTVAIGIVLQLLMALLIFRFPYFKWVFLGLNRIVLIIEKATVAGTSMVFGYLGGGAFPFEASDPAAAYILAFRGLPLVLVVSALSALLFYWRILPVVVRLFSKMLEKALGIGGAVGVGAAANIFLGMVEAPLMIRPYLKAMSRGELFMVMSCGMSTIAGTVLVLYANILQSAIPDALGHVLTASLISAPAALVIAELMVPSGETLTAGDVHHFSDARGAMDAITRGTADGIRLLLQIVAMLIVFVALVSLVNQLLGIFPGPGGGPLTLQGILGYVLAPLAWLLGVSWQEAPVAGSLLGTKVILNEFVAYLNLAALPDGTLSERSRLIVTYALCGFANFGSLGIMIGGMGALVEERRAEIVALGMKSILAGLMATCMTGAVVGLLIFV